MGCPKIQKYSACFNPSEEKDYGRNWSEFLADDEIITASAWVITCEDEVVPTLVENAQGTGISDDQKATSIFLEGGTFELVYELTNNITTVDDATSIRKYSRTGLITVVSE